MRCSALVLLSTLLMVVSSAEIAIYARNIATGKKQELGILSFDPDVKTSSFEGKVAPVEIGAYCLGTHDLPGKECFAYQEVDGAFGGELRVFVNEQGGLEDVTFARDLAHAQLASRVVDVALAPKPNLDAVSQRSSEKQQKPLTEIKKVVRKRLVENEQGEKEEIEEEVEEVVEVDNRSWIQRNWMYIVPPLVIYLIMAPNDKN